MVTFKLHEKNEVELIYLYYPERDETKRPGIITVDRTNNVIQITELAERDYERMIQPEELNSFADVINEMNQESGDEDFFAYVTKPVRSAYYGDHAVSEIRRRLSSGEIPENGISVWY